MPHISLPDGLPGILGPMAFRPETAEPIQQVYRESGARLAEAGYRALTVGLAAAR